MGSKENVKAPQVEAVVQQGWRRRLLVVAVDEAALVFALLFATLAILIVLGTQILAWQWVWGVGLVALGLAVWKIRRRLTDRYRVAQLMDQRLALSDALSTAWFLQSNANADHSAVAFQVSHAEQLAASADPALAFPFERSKAWIVTAGLFITAFGLFVARYVVTSELSLRQSFLPLSITQAFENLKRGGAKAENPQITERTLPQNSALPTPPATPDDRITKQTQKAEAPVPNAPQGQNYDSKPNAQSQNPGSETKPGTKGEDGKQGSQQPQPNATERPTSVMDRMKDALSSVMSKMNPTGAKSDAAQSAQKDAQAKGPQNPSANKQQSGEGQKDSEQDQSAQEQASGDQQAKGAAKAQSSQSKDSAQPSNKKGSDAQSGVGHSDGDKQLKQAEQIQAMGKLAEIIGKRSASLTGDMHIEQSGKQRLQTGDTHQQGQHADAGGEITRDEIPVEDQAYVREYMERVRRESEARSKSR